jgi:hypothetical protein
VRQLIGQPLDQPFSPPSNTSVFSQPAPCFSGNASRLLIHESICMEFHAEIFTNAPVFAARGKNYRNAQFGFLDSQANSPRKLQCGLKLYR